MKEPVLYQGSSALDWSLDRVVELVTEINKLGCMEELLREANDSKFVVNVPPETINFVKKFLFHNGHHKQSKTAHAIVESAACIPHPVPPTPSPGPPVFPPPGPNDPPPM